MCYSPWAKYMYVYEIRLRQQKQIVISYLAFSSLGVDSQVVRWQNNITEFSSRQSYRGGIHDEADVIYVGVKFICLKCDIWKACASHCVGVLHVLYSFVLDFHTTKHKQSLHIYKAYLK